MINWNDLKKALSKFKLLLWHLSGKTEEYIEKRWSLQSMTYPLSEPRIWRKRNEATALIP
jgi:hypothetical protein